MVGKGVRDQVYKSEVGARWVQEWCKDGAREVQGGPRMARRSNYALGRFPGETYQKKKRGKEILRPPMGQEEKEEEERKKRLM